MAIEMQCPGCGQTLRVGDEHAGKQARCPQCGTITRVPGQEQRVGRDQSPAEDFLGNSPFAGGATPEPNPFADREVSPYRSPQAFPGVSPTPGYQRPHRGGSVLTFGILGLVFMCFCGVLAVPFGAAAWVMGSGDVKAMRQGAMDYRGLGTTQAGMILGIISTIIGFLIGGLQILMVVAG